jgi:hypothetical protein
MPGQLAVTLTFIVDDASQVALAHHLGKPSVTPDEVEQFIREASNDALEGAFMEYEAVFRDRETDATIIH